MTPDSFVSVPSAMGVPGSSGPKLLISVFPKRLALELRHEGFKTYVLEPAAKGKISKLVVNDTYAVNRNFMDDSGGMYAAPVSGRVVADNLMSTWSKGMIRGNDGLGPGIMICESLVPSQEEISAILGRQEAYFRALVYEADALESLGNIKEITEDHRLAAEWLAVQDREWVRPLRAEAAPQECPACAENIKAKAKVCKHCHVNIAEFLAGEVQAATARRAPSVKEIVKAKLDAGV